jgi:inhibitor of KinA sporulation pathway (predicted exonuclease)
MPRDYLILDLEATCWQRGDPRQQQSEIIEIGAVLFTPGSDRAGEEFQSFVRPVRHPILSDFCQELTGIRQRNVDGAPGFPEVLSRLMAFLEQVGRVLLCSWGDYDRGQLKKDCRYHKVRYPFGKKHVNLKQCFADRIRCRQCGMEQALKMLHMDLQGTHHRAIDDARNTTRIVRALSLLD